jgi:phosphatidylglycerol:prolipoprotein diacylglycerol transferase
MSPVFYRILMVAGILVSLAFWWRQTRGERSLIFVYLAGLCGAFLGAKIAYMAAEGWLFAAAADRWLQWATGKSILGALLGGYTGVELSKQYIGYRKVTGDLFAFIAPIGIILGRFGCLLHGCCLGTTCDENAFALHDSSGVARWPAVPLEISFNLAAVIVFALLRKKALLRGQHFHLYLIGYGTFRFFLEFVRDTPKILGAFSGYQMIASLLLLLGIAGYLIRKCANGKSGLPGIEAQITLTR